MNYDYNYFEEILYEQGDYYKIIENAPVYIKIKVEKKCADYALEHGIIIADTKFEFGLDENGNIVIGDEMLTPDSSRFWPADEYEPGHGQPSFDKQFARDWLKNNDHDWKLPQDIVDKTIDKYFQAYKMLTGKDL